MTEPWENIDAVLALVDLAARTGARELEIGYLDEGVPAHMARWFAQVRWRGALLWADEKPSPQIAADELAHKLLDGANCTACNKSVSVGKDTDGHCCWRREGERWIRGCDGKRQATKKGAV